MKKIIVVLCIFFTLNIYSQKKTFIKLFVRDLFDENISDDNIAKSYLIELKSEKRFSNSLKERKNNQLIHINKIRKERETKYNWLIPNESNNDPKNIIESYNSYKHLDTISWASKPKKRIMNKMYVLLDEDKSCILQYFLLCGNKIKSYSLFVKSGEALFFEY